MFQWLGIKAICALCGHYHDNHTVLCDFCIHLLIPIKYSCKYCMQPLVDDKLLICGYCIKKRPYFDRIITNYLFIEPLRTLLHDFKYNHALYLRDFFAQLMLKNQQIYTIDPPDCLIPMPLHKKRIKSRGFNQAAEITKLLSKALKIAYNNNICKKILHTAPQVGLTAVQRYKNLQNSFIVKKSQYKYVVIVDDLVTTGSTANELAKVCKQSGIERVDIWCCARAIHHTS